MAAKITRTGLIIALGTGLVVVVVTMSAQGVTRIEARAAVCSNNQRQLVLAMAVYANDNSGQWPVRPSGADGRLLARPSQGLYTSIGSLEFVLAQTGNDITLRNLHCPLARAFGPIVGVNAQLDGTAGTISNWCVSAAHDVQATPGYAYDWAVPANARPERVVIADRSRGELGGHHGRVIACFADMHVGTLLLSAGTPGPGATLNVDGRPIPNQIAPNPAAQDANIYDDAGDGDQSIPGHGSLTGAWVR